MTSPVSELSLSPKVASALTRYVEDLKIEFGSELASLVLYGDVVRGEGNEARADVNVMVVVKQITSALLKRLAPFSVEAISHHRIKTFLVTTSDIESSNDSFPIKFMDMKESYKVIFGSDPLANLEIKKEHLRLQLEHEVKGMMLRLRHMYLFNPRRKKGVKEILLDSFSLFTHQLRTLLVLKGLEAPLAKSKIVAAARKHLGVDEEDVLAKIAALKDGSVKGGDFEELFFGFLAVVRQTAKIVDELPVPR